MGFGISGLGLGYQGFRILGLGVRVSGDLDIHRIQDQGFCCSYEIWCRGVGTGALLEVSFFGSLSGCKRDLQGGVEI